MYFLLLWFSDKFKATDDTQNLSDPVSLSQSSQSDSEPREIEVAEHDHQIVDLNTELDVAKSEATVCSKNRDNDLGTWNNLTAADISFWI